MGKGRRGGEGRGGWPFLSPTLQLLSAAAAAAAAAALSLSTLSPSPSSLLHPLQSTQIYLTVTSATMVGQQLLLRVPAFTGLVGFPSDFPPTAELVAQRNQRRLESGGAGAMTDAFAWMMPFFRRCSAAAEGDFRGQPVHSYLSISTGLRDPGVPRAPAGEPPSEAALPGSGSASAAVAVSGAQPSSSSSVEHASSREGASAAGSQAGGAGSSKAQQPQQLLQHRPKKAAGKR